MRSPDQRKGLSRHYVPPLNDFGSHQVNEFEIALHVHHEVFWLEVSHDDALGGQVLEDEDHRCHVELGVFCAEEPDLPYGVVELLSLDELDKGVEVVLVFEALVVLHDEWVIKTSE